MRIPKINSIHYAGIWITISLLIGAVIPGVLWIIFDKVYIVLIITGSVLLTAFIILFIIEMHQDNSRIPYYEKHLEENIIFNPETQYAVIRSSICTGEKVAGFKNKEDGHFTEVMLIRSYEDELRFKKIYGIDTIKTEY